jgi:large subunit ribosomal protein L21
MKGREAKRSSSAVDFAGLRGLSRRSSPAGSLAGAIRYAVRPNWNSSRRALQFKAQPIMYAVIKTGGKQYRVQPGDILVVEKLPGDPGAVVAFDEVLMIGEGANVTLGAPTVAGASVSATLVETRKGVKVKIFKKIRRQGYRRTRGHRQTETVLRVTALAADGVSETWDGTVDLTPLAVLNARARNLARGMEAAAEKAAAKAAPAPIAPAPEPEVVAKAPAKPKAPKAAKATKAAAPEAAPEASED